MEVLIEQILTYTIVAVLCLAVVWYYLRKQNKSSRLTQQKIDKAIDSGLYEPVSLHPVVDANSCIKSGACIAACPEKDILGIVNGKATTINASECIGHGACYHACPVEAITLVIGTEKRGVDLPHVNQNFETNVPGIYIAGELGGMGLIRNAVEQGKQTVESIFKSKKHGKSGALDVLIVGAGPAGVSAALMCRKLGLGFEIVDQETLGGTVFTFPREKVVMTSPMQLPLYGKIKLYETTKVELLDIWTGILNKHEIKIHEKNKVENILMDGDLFRVETSQDKVFKASNVVLAIGRRGTPRKLKVPGENLPKVAYRLLEPERIQEKDILVVGGGDSAIESALLLAKHNRVILSYRRDKFQRLKPKNRESIQEAIEKSELIAYFESNVREIGPDHVELAFNNEGNKKIPNDLVYIFAGGELPTSFLEKTGIQITRRFGYAVMKH
jgi:thioredoxin reductase/ferredoxin